MNTILKYLTKSEDIKSVSLESEKKEDYTYHEAEKGIFNIINKPAYFKSPCGYKFTIDDFGDNFKIIDNKIYRKACIRVVLVNNTLVSYYDTNEQALKALNDYIDKGLLKDFIDVVIDQ